MSRQNSVELFDPTTDPNPLGVSWNDWCGKWWNWLFSLPIINNPMFAHDIKINGKISARNVNYKISSPPNETNVIFLTGHRSGIADRTCEIDNGKGIFFPVATCECSNAEFPRYTKPQLEQCAHDGNKVTDMEVDIGGFKLNKQQLENKYKFEGPFELDTNKINKNNIFGADNQVNLKEAYSVGYWLFVKPVMAETKFDLMFSQDTEDNPSSNTFNSSFTVRYHITVK